MNLTKFGSVWYVNPLRKSPELTQVHLTAQSSFLKRSLKLNRPSEPSKSISWTSRIVSASIKGVEAISDEIGYSGPEYPIHDTLSNFAKKTREPRLLMRFTLFQKIWKIQEVLQRHFEGFFDLIIQNPCARPFSTISDFEFVLDVAFCRILRKKLGSQDYSCDCFYSKQFGRFKRSSRDIFKDFLIWSWETLPPSQFRP